MPQQSLVDFLNRKVKEYNQPSFIKNDPVCIPHLFHKKEDIEIAAFFAAIFAWGNRTTIINKSKELMLLMNNAPYAFITQHQPKDLLPLMAFKHRTFNTTDLLFFIQRLQQHYLQYSSLETAFTQNHSLRNVDTTDALNGFYTYFFSSEDVPSRTRKHIAAPFKNATCKRLNMFLRWMVRKDECGVDFGIWNKIQPSQLICPVDVHVARVAKKFNLLHRNAIDWQAAVELTAVLKTFHAKDPVQYDYALFALGVVEKF